MIGGKRTYALGSASADIVWKAGNVSWVTHEDGCFDHVYC